VTILAAHANGFTKVGWYLTLQYSQDQDIGRLNMP
jgi:hypothetical protein